MCALAGLPATAAAQDPGTFGNVGLEPRPNVVVVLTDDQETTSFETMDKVDELIADDGITFKNSFASFPLCCPSRATALTGQYAHNHRVLHNNPPTGSISRLDQSNTLPLWLQAAGYYTAHVGKYLNYYEQTPAFVPPGWDGWWTLTGCDSCRPVDRLQHVYRYYGYRLNQNGRLVDYGSEVGDYQTDVLADRAVEVIRERAPEAQPFYLSFDPMAPHGGLPQPSPHPPFDCTGNQVALPAARHAQSADGIALPRPPSFDEEDVSDKPASIRELPRLGTPEINAMTRRYQCRVEALEAVDEAVARIVAALREAGELDNTYIVFTSDNGYMFGEHRVPMEKILLYEPSIRVPLAMRGPGIEPGTATRELVANPDLATTIVRVTGAKPGVPLDGRSLLPVARRPERERGREVLLETIGSTGIRNRRFAYFEHDTGERELYDLQTDPFELENRFEDAAYAEVREALAARLDALRSCAGEECSRLPSLSLRPTPRRSCLRRDATVRLQGEAAGEAIELTLKIEGATIATIYEPPLEHRVPIWSLPQRGGVQIRAIADLADGRRWSGATRVKVCGRAR